MEINKNKISIFFLKSHATIKSSSTYMDFWIVMAGEWYDLITVAGLDDHGKVYWHFKPGLMGND